MLSALDRLRDRLRAGSRSMPIEDFLEGARGGITPAEGEALVRHAASVSKGCAVEIGSYQGKSSVALVHGLGGRPLYCVEPHESFVGVLGGQFGPEDRAQFYRNMLQTEAYGTARLVNLMDASIDGAAAKGRDLRGRVRGRAQRRGAPELLPRSRCRLLP